MTAVICTYPLDVIRARLAFQVTGEHRYTGIGNAFQTIYLKVLGFLGEIKRWCVIIMINCFTICKVCIILLGVYHGFCHGYFKNSEQLQVSLKYRKYIENIESNVQ